MTIKNFYNNDLPNIIQDNYLIDQILSMENSQKGYLSDNYLVKTNTKNYLLKRYYIHRSANQTAKIEFVLKATEFFHQNKIPVILPLKTKDNKYYYIHNNQHFALFPYIQNLQIIRGDLSPKTLSSAGKMLAKIHFAGKRNYPVNQEMITKNWSKEKFFSQVAKILSSTKAMSANNKFGKLLLEQIKLKTDFVKKNQLGLDDLGLKSDHLIHGDYHQRNFSVDKKGGINYVFDLKSKISPRMLELARSMDLICFTNYKNKDFQNATVFLKSYLNIYRVRKSELKNGILGYYIKSFYDLWLEEEYFLENNKVVTKLIEKGLKKFQYIAKNIDQVTDRIIKGIGK